MELLFEASQITLLDVIEGIGVALVLGTIALIISGAGDLEQECEDAGEPEVVPAFDFQLDRPRAKSDLGDVSDRRRAA